MFTLHGLGNRVLHSLTLDCDRAGHTCWNQEGSGLVPQQAHQPSAPDPKGNLGQGSCTTPRCALHRFASQGGTRPSLAAFDFGNGLPRQSDRWSLADTNAPTRRGRMTEIEALRLLYKEFQEGTAELKALWLA